MVATAGALIVFGMQLIPTFFPTSRTSVLRPTSIPEGPDILGYMSRVQQFISGPYVILCWFLVMVYLAISRRITNPGDSVTFDSSGLWLRDAAWASQPNCAALFRNITRCCQGEAFEH